MPASASRVDETTPALSPPQASLFPLASLAPEAFPHAVQAASPVQLPQFPADVTVRLRPCRTALNASDICDYTLNCYGGCMHGCIYCYARYMERFHPHPEPWGKFVDIKLNIAEALRRQLRRLPRGKVFISSACDGWQPAERWFGLTRRAIEMLLAEGFSLRLLTKSTLVLRDLDLLADRPVKLGVSLTTTEETIARIWEPGAAAPGDRLGIIRQAAERGMSTVVMLAPILPGFSDDFQSLKTLIERSIDAGANEIWVDALNRRPKVWESIRALLRREFPELIPLYRAVLFDESARRRYLEGIVRAVSRIASALGESARVQLCFDR